MLHFVENIFQYQGHSFKGHAKLTSQSMKIETEKRRIFTKLLIRKDMLVKCRKIPKTRHTKGTELEKS